MKRHMDIVGRNLLIVLVAFWLSPMSTQAAVMNDYCIQPPFVTQSVPPLVMFDVGRDHKLYYQAYDDASDLDEDGQLDYTYKHSIDYFGYFDPYKCYEFSGGASGGTNANSQFNPVTITSDKFCSSTGGQWSGNVLNWLTMTRMDVLKKVLYGGYRSSDSNNATVLERVFLPQDAHSWGKELTGRLCKNTGTVDTTHPLYTRSCVVSSDCETGYSCIDMSKQLIGIDAVDPPPGCSDAVTVGNVDNKILYATYSHSSSLPSNVQLGNTHTDLMTSFDPTGLLAKLKPYPMGRVMLNGYAGPVWVWPTGRNTTFASVINDASSSVQRF